VLVRPEPHYAVLSTMPAAISQLRSSNGYRWYLCHTRHHTNSGRKIFCTIV